MLISAIPLLEKRGEGGFENPEIEMGWAVIDKISPNPSLPKRGNRAK
jgi:hypothetical protein